MKKVLIIQNYNANKGDSSVIHTMNKTLKEMDNNLSIYLTSYNPELAKEEYKLESAEWLVNFKNIKMAKSKVKKSIFFFKELIWIVYSLNWLLFYKINIRLPLPDYKKNTIQLYLKSDIVVLPGGHFFTNLNAFPVNFSHAYGLLFAKWLGKKTMIYAQTIGPFFGIFGHLTQAMTSFVLRSIDLVTVREKDSLKYCNQLSNIYLTAETVFALPTNKDLAYHISQFKTLREQNEILVGVTIHHIYYKHFFKKNEYIKLMSKIFDNIIRLSSCKILIIPMEANYHQGGDRPIANEMKSLSEYKDDIIILEGDHDPLVTSSVIANTDIFIGTKTHSIVYGLKSNVPTISISYQQKSTEFMKMFGVEENAIDLKNLNLRDFMKIYERVFKKHDEYRKIELSSYRKVKKLALKNNKLLLSLLTQNGATS